MSVRFGAVDAQVRPVRGRVPAGLVKRSMDVALAACGLIVLCPLMLAIALLIKLDSKGPVLFVQQRFGLDSRRFHILKFRTMYHRLCDPTGQRQSPEGDVRVTRLGRWLRLTRIDELPQLINVLLGQMSLVGPRPHPVGMKIGALHAWELVPTYFERYRVKPGMTGLAQIRGCDGPLADRRELVRRLQYDAWYASRSSAKLDLWILLTTIGCVLPLGRMIGAHGDGVGPYDVRGLRSH